MGIAVHLFLWLLDQHPVQKVNGLLPGLLLRELLMATQRLANLLSDGKHWIQGVHGVLKDHGNLIATNFLHLFSVSGIGQEVLSVKEDLSA